MKEIYGILVFVIFVLALSSCDKRMDYFEEINEGVGVNVSLNNGHSHLSSSVNGFNIHDTIKHDYNYSFEVALTDEESTVTLDFIGQGNLWVDGDPFTSGELSTGTHSIVWDSDTTGNYSFSLKFTDAYGVETVYNFHIHVFYNKVPNTWWEVVDDGSFGSLHKQIVVHGSDGDQLYGGNIIYYEYIIGNDTTYHPHSTMNYVFPSPGNYYISVRAKDNNLAWGNQIALSAYPIQ